MLLKMDLNVRTRTFSPARARVTMIFLSLTYCSLSQPGSCLTLSFGVPKSSAPRDDSPCLMTNNCSAIGLTALEEAKIENEVLVAALGAEPPKWRKHLKGASSNSPISRVVSHMSAGVSYMRKRSTTSPSLHGSSNFIYSSPEVSNEHDFGLRLNDNPQRKLFSPTSQKCCSTQQHSTAAANSLSNVALAQFLYGFDDSISSECNDTIPSTPRTINSNSNSTDEKLPTWKMERLLWTDWVSPVIVKRHGAVHAIVLGNLALYILEMKLKDSDVKEAVGCTFPTHCFSLDGITSFRAILRLEPSEIVKVIIPYYSNILDDQSEVAERGTDLYLGTQSGTFAWFNLRTNQHRSELLDCIDEWYSAFMGGNDELFLDQCCYDTVFSHITVTSCDCFVSNPLSEE